MRAVLPVAVRPRDRVGGMGQAREGLGPVELQAAHQPHRPHRVRQKANLNVDLALPPRLGYRTKFYTCVCLFFSFVSAANGGSVGFPWFYRQRELGSCLSPVVFAFYSTGRIVS